MPSQIIQMITSVYEVKASDLSIELFYLREVSYLVKSFELTSESLPISGITVKCVWTPVSTLASFTSP